MGWGFECRSGFVCNPRFSDLDFDPFPTTKDSLIQDRVWSFIRKGRKRWGLDHICT